MIYNIDGGEFMPIIRPSADLRNNYNEISQFCHKYAEPVFITKNGKGDLAVLSIKAYEKLCGKFELYNLLNEGLQAEKAGNTKPLDDVINDLRKGLNSSFKIHKVKIEAADELNVANTPNLSQI